MKETFKIGSMYDENVWERMVAESCGSQFTSKRIFKKKYAVCIETDAGTDVIIHWTDDKDYELKEGQFLVDAETLAVINQYDAKGYFDRLHKRIKDSM